MKPSQACIDLIKSFEGLRLKAYPDPGSVDGKPITIGWGTTNYLNAGVAKYGRSSVMLGDTLTETEAEQELLANIARFAKVINASTNKLNQQQFDSAVSHLYNIGANTKQTQRLKDGDLEGFRKMMLAYVKGGNGTVLEGLVRRRKAEAELWDKGGRSSVKSSWINLVRHENSKTTPPSYFLFAMSGSECVGKHQIKTRQDLLSLLRRYEASENVAIGELNWNVEPNKNTTNYAKLTKTNEILGGKQSGLRKLILEIGGTSFVVCSGQTYAQNFRKPQDPRSYPGNAEPIPEGVYKFSTLLPEMKGGAGNWSSVWSEGLGPMWDGLSATFSDDRSAFGVHYDGGAKGTLGCIGLLTIEDCKRYYDVRKSSPDIKEIHVDWGL